jgi:hypothetical protein
MAAAPYAQAINQAQHINYAPPAPHVAGSLRLTGDTTL